MSSLTSTKLPIPNFDLFTELIVLLARYCSRYSAAKDLARTVLVV